jgi:hypothetical protein
MSQCGDICDIFRECVDKASSFLAVLNGGKRTKFQNFHAQHWMLNVNMTCCGSPMGVPNQIYTAFGSDFGLKLVRETDTREPSKVFADWLVRLQRTLSQDAIRCRGWERDHDYHLVNWENRQPVTVADIEHEFCELMILIERGPGGSRSISNNLNVQSDIHFPIKGLDIDWVEEVAQRACSAFQNIANLGLNTSSTILLSEEDDCPLELSLISTSADSNSTLVSTTTNSPSTSFVTSADNKSTINIGKRMHFAGIHVSKRRLALFDDSGSCDDDVARRPLALFDDSGSSDEDIDMQSSVPTKRFKTTGLCVSPHLHSFEHDS